MVNTRQTMTFTEKYSKQPNAVNIQIAIACHREIKISTIVELLWISNNFPFIPVTESIYPLKNIQAITKIYIISSAFGENVTLSIMLFVFVGNSLKLNQMYV